MVDFNEPRWRKPTPQENGRIQETRIVKSRGGRPHPGSGSGRIRFDGSSEDEVIEAKTAAKTFAMNRSYIATLYDVAVRQGKEPVLVIEFPGYRCVVHIERT
jgi:hypothetical protein